jgi:hypothetical protein
LADGGRDFFVVIPWAAAVALALGVFGVAAWRLRRWTRRDAVAYSGFGDGGSRVVERTFEMADMDSSFV